MVKTIKLKYFDFNNENKNQNYYKKGVTSELLLLWLFYHSESEIGEK